MRVSAKAEYACIAMLELAANHAEMQPVRVKTIADHHDIPQRFLVQILLQLKAAGLVVSLRGSSGGYQLVRSPNNISVADVVNAIDSSQQPRPVPATAATSPAVKAIHSVWQQAQAQEQRLLEETTLSELVRRLQKDNALSYQI
jgi:Rrf2 family transcriptional regulator, cysteine metabolism repressor